MKDYSIEIDAYLNDTMSISEKQKFEEILLANPELLKELKLQKEMLVVYEDIEWLEGDKDVLKTDEAKKLKSFFESKEAANLKSTIQEVISENTSKSINKPFWFVGIAASIAILITVSLFVFKENSLNELYTQYIHLNEIPSLVTRGKDSNKLLENAQLLFEDQKYQKAVETFIKYHRKEDSIEPLSYIYMGVAYLELNEFDKALKQFEELSNTLQAKKINWYKAMTFLKQNKKDELIAVLQTILSDTNNYKYKEAQVLMQQVNK
ncbi:hypothetical protein [uncultured Lacinutrix sp.]|uniref:tetratricopeptide repeat protein n=1 Tax=uncultured Lacinutrix sp. TaxID=574032 RepID=UPI00260BEEF8|nr:hypothetical protein [uncultured Lacinutrix sp.]